MSELSETIKELIAGNKVNAVCAISEPDFSDEVNHIVWIKETTNSGKVMLLIATVYKLMNNHDFQEELLDLVVKYIDYVED